MRVDEFQSKTPKWYIWACLECGEQSRGPTGHQDDGRNCSCGMGLAHIEVRPIDLGTAGRLHRANRDTQRQRWERNQEKKKAAQS